MKTVVITHPEFTCQNFSIEDQVALANKGCLIERCLTTPHSGKTTYEHVFEGVRAVGIERNFFSSDCGNPDYPPVEDGLAIWADELLEARVLRGRDPDDGGRGVAEAGGSEPPDAGHRRALGRLRLAGRRRDRGHDLGRRSGAGAGALLRRARGVGRALEGRGDDGRARQGGPRAARPSAPPRTSARPSRASTSATTRSSSTRTA